MADIIVQVAKVLDVDGRLYIFGTCFSAGSGEVLWDLTTDYSVIASGINDAIRDAAIAAMGVKGVAVGALDKKVLCGGVLNL